MTKGWATAASRLCGRRAPRAMARSFPRSAERRVRIRSASPNSWLRSVIASQW